MTLLEKLKLIERMDQLIRMKATGNPKDLASRIDKSERCVYQIIKLMKEMGAPIYYCFRYQSYCYEYQVNFNVGFTHKTKMVIGGSHLQKLSSLNYSVRYFEFVRNDEGSSLGRA